MIRFRTRKPRTPPVPDFLRRVAGAGGLAGAVFPFRVLAAIRVRP